MRPSQLLAAVVALSSVSAAWPDVFDKVNAIADVDMLFRRQDNSESAEPTKTAAPKSSAAEDDDKASSTGKAEETDKASATEKETGKATASGKASGTKSGSKASATKSLSIGDDVPAGSISMVTPAPIAGMQFYKVRDWVTFAWNYTSLSVSPDHVDIMATCTANQALYTIAVNQSIDQSTVLWDTKEYQESASVPLLTETYTLLIYDSESSVSATAEPGHLAVYNQHVFGMYTPRPRVDWKDFTCANCNPNSALGAFDSLTLRALLITSGTTVASLLYFAFSFGVL